MTEPEGSVIYFGQVVKTEKDRLLHVVIDVGTDPDPYFYGVHIIRRLPLLELALLPGTLTKEDVSQFSDERMTHQEIVEGMSRYSKVSKLPDYLANILEHSAKTLFRRLP